MESRINFNFKINLPDRVALQKACKDISKIRIDEIEKKYTPYFVTLKSLEDQCLKLNDLIKVIHDEKIKNILREAIVKGLPLEQELMIKLRNCHEKINAAKSSQLTAKELNDISEKDLEALVILYKPVLSIKIPDTTNIIKSIETSLNTLDAQLKNLTRSNISYEQTLFQCCVDNAKMIREFLNSVNEIITNTAKIYQTVDDSAERVMDAIRMLRKQLEEKFPRDTFPWQIKVAPNANTYSPRQFQPPKPAVKGNNYQKPTERCSMM